MRIKIKEGFKKIFCSDIENIESYFGCSLPSEYKTFLLKNNGGRIEPRFFKTINNEIESSIQFMFGITDEKNYDLIFNYKHWAENIRIKNALPIAIDVVGNYIFLNLVNNSVYLWVHDFSDNPIFLIATNFGLFLTSLYTVVLEQTETDIAIARQDIEYFNRVISSGEKIDSIKNQFDQPIAIAAALGNKVRLLKYFYESKADMKMTLFSAASNGHYEAVNYLLSIGLNPDERDPEQNDDTAMIQAAFGGHLAIVKRLIEAGANIKAKDRYGQGVLQKAYWSNNNDLVEYLQKINA